MTRKLRVIYKAHQDHIAVHRILTTANEAYIF